MQKLYTSYIIKVLILINIVLYSSISFANHPVSINVNVCVYLSTKPVTPMKFDFTAKGIGSIGTGAQSDPWYSTGLPDVTLTTDRSGVSCVSMGSIKSSPYPDPKAITSDFNRLIASHLISYSSPDYAYNNSVNLDILIVGNDDVKLSGSSCNGKNGLIQLSENGNSQLCRSPSFCDNQTKYCYNTGGDYYIIFNILQ